MKKRTGKVQRVIAMLLAVAMIATNVNYVFAAEESQEYPAEANQEAAQEMTSTGEDVAPAAEATPAAEVAPAAEDTTAAPQNMVEASAQGVIETPVAEEPATVVPEEAEPAVNAAAAASETSYPAFEMQKNMDGVTTVTVSAPEGVLPEGTTAVIENVDYEDEAQDALDQGLEGTTFASVDACMADVTLLDKDGNVIQPNGKVTVTMKHANLDVPEEYEALVKYNAYRINQDGTLTVLKENVDISKESISFENDHFTAVGIAAVADLEAAVSEAATLAEDEYYYQGYKTGNSFIGGSQMNFHVENTKNPGETYVAYCYNMHLGRPDGTTGSMYRKGDTPASTQEFVDSLASDSPNKLSADELQLRVMSVLNAGYPYNNAGLIDYARNDLKISEAKLNDALRVATQYAIWHYTDGFYVEIPINRAGQQQKLIGALVDYAEAQTSFPEGLDLTIFYPKDDRKQNLLTTNKPEGTDVTKKVVKIEVKVTKQWSNPMETHDAVTVKLFADGVDTGKTVTLSADNNWSTSFTDLEAGKEYTVNEVPVAGYTASVSGNATTGYIIKNTENTYDVTISKTNLGGEEIAGANIQILAEDRRTVKATWISEENNSKVLSLAKGIYYFHEETAPTGYVKVTDIKFEVDENGKVRVLEEDGNEVYAENSTLTVVDEYAKYNVVISKIDLGGNEIGGAEITIYDEWNDVVEEWTSEEGKNHIITVQPGTYTFHEETAPDGYVAVTDITFTVALDGTVTVTDADNNEVEVNNNKLTVTDQYANQDLEISKVNVAGEELEGAELTITDVNGNEVVSWTSDGTARKISVAPGTYTLTEIKAPDGYEIAESITFTVDKEGKVTVHGQDVDGTVIMVDAYETTSFQVKKNWDDNNNQDGFRPTSLEVKLLNNGIETGKTAILTAPNWEATFTDLRTHDDDGVECEYSAEEVMSDETRAHYTESKEEVRNGMIFTNTHETETIEVSGKKIWKDQNNAAGVRPESITVLLKKSTLTRGDETVQSQVVKEDEEGNWTYTFENLPKYEDGKIIQYFVQENVPEGYVSSVEDYNITNTRANDKVNVQVQKKWDDRNNQDGIRPNAVTVNLYADGEKVEGETARLNDGNKWFCIFEDLPKNNDDGSKIEYTVKEDAVANYTSQITTDGNENHFVITNTHEPAITKITGEKIWMDQNNQDGKRPDFIIVTLYADGEAYAQAKVSADTEWKYEFPNLPENKAGAKIVYTVDEDNVPDGYSKSIKGSNITNTYTPGKISISVNKNWEDNNNQDGIRPDSLTVSLYANGVDTGKTVNLDANNAWTATFDDLDLYKAGRLIDYSVKESAFLNSDKYKASTQVSADKKTITLTNAYEPERISVKGIKVWDDHNNAAQERPKEITVLLKKAGVTIDRKVVTENAEGKWEYSFDHLPKYENGVEIRYSIQEDAVPENYQSSVVKNPADGTYILTNKYSFQQIAVQVAKSWEDDNNRDGIRPTSVTVKLFANGVDTGRTLALNAENNWTANFEDLDEYYVDGTKIVYTVEEVPVEGYETTITSHQEGRHFTITNTHESKLCDITVTKEWLNDKGNAESQRPNYVTIGLFKNVGETKELVEVTQIRRLQRFDGTPDEWTYTFKNLQENENGKKISYTIEELDNGEVYSNAVDYTDLDNGNITLKNTKITNEIRISKQNIGGEELKGAKLVIGTSAGYLIEEWESNGTPHSIKIAPGEYVMYEDVAPAGYELLPYDAQIWFTVDDAGNVTVIRTGGEDVTATGNHLVLVNKYEKHNVKFSKVDLGGKELAGAEITVSGKTSCGTDVEAESWISDGTPHEISLPMGEYTMTETAAPKGYEISTEITFTVDENGEVAVKGTTTGSAEDGVVTMVDGYQSHKVKLSKVDLGGDEIVGAEITISGKDKSGNDVESKQFVSTVEPMEISLPAGSYIFHEETAPNGYVAVTDIAFEVGLDGKVSVTDAAGNTVRIRQDGTLEVTDVYAEHKVKVSKVDIVGEEIEGAEITVNGADRAGNEIQEISWTSGTDPKEIELPAGTYTFVENYAPEGYELVNEVIFEVDLDGNVIVVDAKGNTARSNGSDTLIVTDRYLNQDVTISKTDITGTEEIEGAELVVKNLLGGEVVSWTSVKDESHHISVQPGIYVLSETTAPKGYKVTESIAFKVDHLGNITIMQLEIDEDGDVSYEEKESVRKVVMKDDYADGKVVISKTDVAGSEIPGAKLEITDKDGNVVKEWTSEAGKNKEVELYPGTYTLVEKTAPKGYEVAESITFTVNHLNHVTIDGEEVGKVTMVDEYSDHTVIFKKTDIAGKELEGATIVLKNKDGEIVEKWVTEGKEKEFSLKPGEYTFEETAAPKGYKIATKITFQVGIDGKISSQDVTVTGSDENLIVMVDEYEPKTTPKTTPKNESKQLSRTVKTGDGARTGTWAMMFVMSLAVIAGVIRRKKYQR